jgi:ferrous iron transport protein B
MKNVLLMGNPNVGKSAVFSRLTGVKVLVSNYPGTTVEFTQGAMCIDNERLNLIDVPGVYGLEPYSKADRVALEMLEKGDVVINVVDATNLERSLHLTLHLLERKIPLVIALNFWDETKHKGVSIDIDKAEKILGVPVIPTVGITGQGIKNLVSRLQQAKVPAHPKRTEEEKWAYTGKFLEQVQTLKHRHHTFLELLGEGSVRPLTGLPMAAGILFAAFKVVRFIGEGLIDFIFEPLFNDLFYPLIMQLSRYLNPGSFIHSVLIGKLIEGNVDFVESLGVLTTGLFVPIAMVLPYIFAFYLVLGFLEDLGYLPRVATLLDSIMHKLGLHGWAIIPNMLGLGCNVPGIMATRILESRRERFIAATIISIGVPCVALQAMIWGLVGAYGIGYVGIVYSSLFFSWVILGLILNKFIKGRSPELIMEIPPYRLPSVYSVIKKLGFRLTGFLKEALPVVLTGVLVINILYYFNLFEFIANLTAPVIKGWFGLPKEAVASLAVGFLRKDVAVGMLGTLGLSLKQLIVAVTVLSMFFPCVATFVVLLKELGLKDMIKSVTIMIISSLIVGGALNLILENFLS